MKRFARPGAKVLFLALSLLPVVNMMRLAWITGAGGISPVNRKLLEWDFTNTWAGGVLARLGRLDILFNAVSYTDWLRKSFGHSLASHQWSYPPTMLLISWPLGLLPLYWAYLAWSIGGLAFLVIVMRIARTPGSVVALALISPATWTNLTFGQNGALTAACFVGGLMIMESRPVLAGCLFGLLTIKPQLGLMIPVCILARRNWRCLGAAVASTMAIMGTTVALFGLNAWVMFFTRTEPLMRSFLEAPWHAGFQNNAVTVFLSVRALGAPLALSYSLQFGVAVICLALSWKAWARTTADPAIRVSFVSCMAILATPYGYSYDMIPFAFAIACLVRRTGWTPVLILAWIYPGLTSYLTRIGLPLSPLVVLAVAALAWTCLGGEHEEIAGSGAKLADGVGAHAPQLCA